MIQCQFRSFRFREILKFNYIETIINELCDLHKNIDNYIFKNIFNTGVHFLKTTYD